MSFLFDLFSGTESGPVVLFSWVVGIAALWGTWVGLTKSRSARFYPYFWTVSVPLLTAWWGSALTNAIIVGRGTPGNGWDAFGAAFLLFMSIPAFVWDIVFLLRWPKIFSQIRLKSQGRDGVRPSE